METKPKIKRKTTRHPKVEPSSYKTDEKQNQKEQGADSPKDDFHENLQEKLLKPSAIAIIGADLIFLTTIIQKYTVVDIPQLVPFNVSSFYSPFFGFLGLSISILFTGFWYVVVETAKFLGTQLLSESKSQWLWAFASIFGIIGISITIALANIWIGAGFGILFVILEAILVFMIWNKYRQLSASTSK